jgi:hypothetical protein
VDTAAGPSGVRCQPESALSARPGRRAHGDSVAQRDHVVGGFRQGAAIVASGRIAATVEDIGDRRVAQALGRLVAQQDFVPT